MTQESAGNDSPNGHRTGVVGYVPGRGTCSTSAI